MDKKVKYTIFFFCSLFINCVDNSKKLSYQICKDSIQYWNYNSIRDGQSDWFTFSFDKKGIVKKYSFYKNKRWLFSDYPGPVSNKWTVTEDSILTFLWSSVKIIKISGDTLYAIGIDDNKKEKFIRVIKGDLNIQKIDKEPEEPIFLINKATGDTVKIPRQSEH
jgi:hypothetical protein